MPEPRPAQSPKGVIRANSPEFCALHAQLHREKAYLSIPSSRARRMASVRRLTSSLPNSLAT